jgi:hypothetical protein
MEWIRHEGLCPSINGSARGPADRVVSSNAGFQREQHPMSPRFRKFGRWLAEAIIFVAIATLLLVVALQQDAPTKFIYYNF